MKTTTPSSKCCKATFHVQGSDGGTNCYVCDKCGKACDPRVEKQGERKCECGHDRLDHDREIISAVGCSGCSCNEFFPSTPPQPSPVTEEWNCERCGIHISDTTNGGGAFSDVCTGSGGNDPIFHTFNPKHTTIPADGGWEEIQEVYEMCMQMPGKHLAFHTYLLPVIKSAISTAVEEKEREWRGKVEDTLKHAEQDVRGITVRIAANIIGGQEDIKKLEEDFLTSLRTYLLNPYDKSEKN